MGNAVSQGAVATGRIPGSSIAGKVCFPQFRQLLWAALIVCAAFTLVPQETLAADLEPKTVRGFDDYIRALEARANRQELSPGTFLDIQNLPPQERSEVYKMLKHGDIYVEQLHEEDRPGHVVRVPGGWVHHFVGAVYIPNATVEEAVAVLEDFGHYQDVYAPQILQSKILSHDGDDYKVFMQLQKKTVVTATVNMNEDVHVKMLDPDHASVRTHSTRIAQVEDYGEPSQHEDSPGHDSGFVWRMNTYWRVEKWSSGVILESETVVLSRTMPFALRWFVAPLVARLSEGTVRDSMTGTRGAIFKHIATSRMQPAATSK
jgi:hypothetical protein